VPPLDAVQKAKTLFDAELGVIETLIPVISTRLVDEVLKVDAVTVVDLT
jgi:hypothetical protein